MLHLLAHLVTPSQRQPTGKKFRARFCSAVINMAWNLPRKLYHVINHASFIDTHKGWWATGQQYTHTHTHPDRQSLVRNCLGKVLHAHKSDTDTTVSSDSSFAVRPLVPPSSYRSPAEPAQWQRQKVRRIYDKKFMSAPGVGQHSYAMWANCLDDAREWAWQIFTSHKHRTLSHTHTRIHTQPVLCPVKLIERKNFWQFDNK